MSGSVGAGRGGVPEAGWCRLSTRPGAQVDGEEDISTLHGILEAETGIQTSEQTLVRHGRQLPTRWGRGSRQASAGWGSLGLFQSIRAASTVIDARCFKICRDFLCPTELPKGSMAL